jgi:16S rRNA (adenine1518-N6/adenine1519-N6)-dimethyltransferase
MNLPPLDVPALLRQYGLHPDKRLGQNFLTDPTALTKVAEAASITKEDTVLEIGPGIGNLTRYLASQAGKVIAIELDRALIAPLHQVLKPFPNVDIVQCDILDINPGRLIHESGYLVVANIPYYITSAVIRHLLESDTRPSRIVLTVQYEVARRICAEPGDLSLLALSVQVYGQPRILAKIPAGAFYPAPQVDSAILRLDLYDSPVIPEDQLDTFFRLIKAGFAQKRKKLRNSLAAGLSEQTDKIEAVLRKAGIDPDRRAETLGLDEWREFLDVYNQSEG